MIEWCSYDISAVQKHMYEHTHMGKTHPDAWIYRDIYYIIFGKALLLGPNFF